MSTLTVYKESDKNNVLFETSDAEVITTEMGKLGARFERWATPAKLSAMPSDDEIRIAYQREIDAFIATEGFKSYDVISVREHTPDADQLRAKYLAEHTHTEDEVRFFVEGSGIFYVHAGDLICRLVCEKGDLVSVPSHVAHWYDMGEKPNFTAIRLFNHPDGWVGYPVKK